MQDLAEALTWKEGFSTPLISAQLPAEHHLVNDTPRPAEGLPVHSHEWEWINSYFKSLGLGMCVHACVWITFCLVAKSR